MKKLMKYITEINMMIGQQIKALVAVLLLIICTGCNPEIPLQYDLVLDNRTAAELEIKFYNANDGAFAESYLLSPFTIKRTFFSVGVFENEVVVEEFFNSWYGTTRFFKNDSLMIEWNSPAYYGGNENHFYNINAWEVENSHPSNFIDGTFTFTIYPEDLVQEDQRANMVIAGTGLSYIGIRSPNFLKGYSKKDGWEIEISRVGDVLNLLEIKN